MELQAAIEALSSLKEPCKVDFFIDSAYLRNGVTKWIEKWHTCGWVTNGDTPVRNQDLWKKLNALKTSHFITWHWVKGHSGNTYNERCDRLARLEIANINRSYSQAELKGQLTVFFERHGLRSHPNKIKNLH